MCFSYERPRESPGPSKFTERPVPEKGERPILKEKGMKHKQPSNDSWPCPQKKLVGVHFANGKTTNIYCDSWVAHQDELCKNVIFVGTDSYTKKEIIIDTAGKTDIDINNELRDKVFEYLSWGYKIDE